MVPITRNYITRAWTSEMHKHERTISELRIKMEKLSKELMWEFEQHHSRLQELYLLNAPQGKEATLNPPKSPSKDRDQKTIYHLGEKAYYDIHPFGEPALIRMTGKSSKKEVHTSNHLELPA